MKGKIRSLQERQQGKKESSPTNEADWDIAMASASQKGFSYDARLL